MTDHLLLACARARVDAHGRCTPVMQEMGAVLDALGAERARAERQQAAAEQYLSDGQTYRRQLAERDATIAALQADLTVLKRAPRGTNPQILKEREITASAISGAMSFGYQDTNPAAPDHWLAPWWQRGREYAVLEADRDILARNLDLLMSVTRGVPPFTEILGYTSNAGLLDMIRRVDEDRIDAEARRYAGRGRPVPVVGTINDGVVETRPTAEDA